MERNAELYLLAKPGMAIPIEGQRRRFLPQGTLAADAEKAVRVNSSRWWRTMIAEGAVIVVPKAKARPQPKPKQKKTTDGGR